jgi:hypothetical protein
LHDGNSYQELPQNDGNYIIQLGRSVVLFCNVTSTVDASITWTKSTYQSGEDIQGQKFRPEFSSSGFGWTSVINILQFNYTDAGKYRCSSSSHIDFDVVTFGFDVATLYVEGG